MVNAPPSLQPHLEGHSVLREVREGKDGALRGYVLQGGGPRNLLYLKLCNYPMAASAKAWLERDWPGWPRIRHLRQIEGNNAGFTVLRDWVRGQPLAELLAPEHAVKAVDAAFPAMVSLCQAVSLLHDKNEPHLALSPRNVILQPTGAVWITDPLLLDRYVAGDGSANTVRLFSTGDAFYQSPEILKNENIGPASDIYSIGCLLYHLLYGTPPFVGDTPLSTSLAHLLKPLEFPSDSPYLAWRPLLKKLLAKTPAERPQHARDVLADLWALREAKVPGTMRTGPPRLMEVQPPPEFTPEPQEDPTTAPTASYKESEETNPAPDWVREAVSNDALRKSGALARTVVSEIPRPDPPPLVSEPAPEALPAPLVEKEPEARKAPAFAAEELGARIPEEERAPEPTPEPVAEPIAATVEAPPPPQEESAPVAAMAAPTVEMGPGAWEQPLSALAEQVAALQAQLAQTDEQLQERDRRIAAQDDTLGQLRSRAEQAEEAARTAREALEKNLRETEARLEGLLRNGASAQGEKIEAMMVDRLAESDAEAARLREEVKALQGRCERLAMEQVRARKRWQALGPVMTSLHGRSKQQAQRLEAAETARRSAYGAMLERMEALESHLEQTRRELTAHSENTSLRDTVRSLEERLRHGSEGLRRLETRLQALYTFQGRQLRAWLDTQKAFQSDDPTDRPGEGSGTTALPR